MIGFDAAKSGFFDKSAVLARMSKVESRYMSKFGAYCRQDARSSIRRSKKISAPGSPPRAHATDNFATLKNILFTYEPRLHNVVIGPVKLNSKQYLGNRLTAGTVPSVLEYGGTEGIREKQVGDKWLAVGRRKPRPGQATRIRLARYAPRPFMHPAFHRTLAKLPDMMKAAAAA